MSERKTLKKKVYPVLEEYYKKKKKQRINERNNESCFKRNVKRIKNVNE